MPFLDHNRVSAVRAAATVMVYRMKAQQNDPIRDHTQLFSRPAIAFSGWSPEEPETMAPMPRVLVRTHPRSGRVSLFLSLHAGRTGGAEFFLPDITNL